jgi:hypothetical protein
MRHKKLKGFWCIRKPSLKWVKRAALRLAVLSSVGIVSYMVLTHFHVPGFISLGPSYLAERAFFEWFGDSIASGMEV